MSEFLYNLYIEYLENELLYNLPDAFKDWIMLQILVVPYSMSEILQIILGTLNSSEALNYTAVYLLFFKMVTFSMSMDGYPIQAISSPPKLFRP